MLTLPLLVITAIPTTIGVCEAVSAQKKQNAAQKETAKFHLTARLSLGGRPAMEAWVVLKDGKLWIDHQQSPVEGHKFTGYYFTYPSEEQHRGLVSTISIDPPMLNWIYVDNESGAVRHGGRKDTLGHIIGPWGWSGENDMFLTLREDADCFVAEEDSETGKWFVALLDSAGSGTGRHRNRDQRLGRGQGAAERVNGTMGDYDDHGEEEEEEEERDDELSGPRRARIRLRRRMVLGMESKYVKNE